MSAEDYIEDLLSVGRCTFTTDDVVETLDKGRDAANAYVRRLRKKGRVATPARGFHVVVPPEYRNLGCLPPQEFVPFLMNYLDREYYTGLLSAAFFHGAAHQQPQAFQVMVERLRPDVDCGRTCIEFHRRHDLADVPTTLINTDFGQLAVSTPEATAIDLVGFASQIGGLDRVATLLVELADEIDGRELNEVGPRIAPDAWLQRLGFVLDFLGFEALALPLQAYVDAHVEEVTPLVPGRNARSGQTRNPRWLVAVNHDLSTET